MIVKVSGGYIVRGKGGKRLSRKYKTKGAAVRRLRQIEYFKRHKR